MLDHLQGMVKTLDELLGSVDPALLHPTDAVKVLDAAGAVEADLFEMNEQRPYGGGIQVQLPGPPSSRWPPWVSRSWSWGQALAVFQYAMGPPLAWATRQ